ncbi:LOW QUALITY PROTEIN: galectin-4-like [Dermochelys coriacea]|uniref:LOW QUALITY PROTEIN: galectin-4-like n=1 Tax=Dermochelys coriacea TaxID=27794 RepID=UPI0018E7C249|nr:LOW QUALITY PROTEIN: galectin-4-like [Dermochelys coriacea]
MAFQQPILNPTVPFSGPIFGGLYEGKMVLIQGIVQTFVKSFGVNLRCGNGDIAFHLNPRFNEDRPVVVCNTEQNGCWGAEERTYRMPFQPGIYFEVIINVKGHCYQVSVNGQHLLEYRHRLSLHTVQILEIKGDVTVNCINFTNPSGLQGQAAPAYGIHSSSISNVFAQTVFGAPAPRRKKVKNFPGQVSAALHNTPVTVTNPVVPIPSGIPGNIAQDRKITIMGNVPFHANSFYVNLKNSMTGNIALHSHPRLKEKALVRNTQSHGTWGSEERHVAILPFVPGQAFQMEIMNTRNCYQVSVNGLRVFDYVHRIPANQVDQLQIAGDVTLSFVQY